MITNLKAQKLNYHYDRPHSAKRLRTVDNNYNIIDAPGLGNIKRDDIGVNNEYFFEDTSTRKGVVEDEDAARVISIMEQLYISDHTKVKDNESWQTLYRRADRKVSFMDTRGNINPGKGGNSELITYPCYYCGIVLPEQLIQIDHQKPQAYPGAGILKLFHSVKLKNNKLLTIAGAKGQKNRQIDKILSKDIVNLTPVEVKGYQFGHPWSVKQIDNNRLARYTISDEGKTILTLIGTIWGKSTPELWGKNSILNLVPACAKCNNDKQDKIHVH